MIMKSTLVSVLSLALFQVGLSVTTLAQESESNGGHVFSKVDSLEEFSRGPMLSKFMLSAEQTDGRYSIIKEIFKPGMSSYPGHTHKLHSEVFFIISGVMESTVNGDTQQIGTGDLLYIPPNSLHAIKVVGDEDVHALMLYEPAGYEENYFRRKAMTEEELNDPAVMREFMQQADVHINR
jgi:quercetin dioxygenase-like cupin family protein